MPHHLVPMDSAGNPVPQSDHLDHAEVAVEEGHQSDDDEEDEDSSEVEWETATDSDSDVGDSDDGSASADEPQHALGRMHIAEEISVATLDAFAAVLEPAVMATVPAPLDQIAAAVNKHTESMTLREMKQLLDARGADYSKCIEKSEIRALVAAVSEDDFARDAPPLPSSGTGTAFCRFDSLPAPGPNSIFRKGCTVTLRNGQDGVIGGCNEGGFWSVCSGGEMFATAQDNLRYADSDEVMVLTVTPSAGGWSVDDAIEMAAAGHVIGSHLHGKTAVMVSLPRASVGKTDEYQAALHQRLRDLGLPGATADYYMRELQSIFA